MKSASLEFMKYLLMVDSPFHNFSVRTYKSYVEVNINPAGAIKPTDLGWLNTHSSGGRWSVILETEGMVIRVCFDDVNDD